MRALRHAPFSGTRLIASSGAAIPPDARAILINADARSSAVRSSVTAASSAAISAAVNHSRSSPDRNGNLQKRSTIFFKLSRRRTCAISCWIATSISLELRSSAACPDTKSLGRQTPLTRSAGAAQDISNAGTPTSVFKGRELAVHAATKRDAWRQHRQRLSPRHTGPWPDRSRQILLQPHAAPGRGTMA